MHKDLKKSGLLVKEPLLSKEQITLDLKVILPRVNLKNGLQEKEQMLLKDLITPTPKVNLPVDLKKNGPQVKGLQLSSEQTT